MRKKYNVAFEERRRRTIIVTAECADEARGLVERSHGLALEELNDVEDRSVADHLRREGALATRVVREAAYCAQYLIVASVEETRADLGGSLGYEGATPARRST